MAKNRTKVKSYIRSDGVKIKSHVRRGTGSQTYGTNTIWDKKSNTLKKRKRKR